MEGEKDNPVVVEFSFKYKNKQEEYDREVSQKVYDIFGKLQQDDLAGWVNHDGKIKTTYVYSKASWLHTAEML